MRYNEFREKVVSDFTELATTGMTRDEICRCCHLFGILAGVLSAPDEIKDEDLLKMFSLGYTTTKANCPVEEVVTITLPKKPT